MKLKNLGLTALCVSPIGVGMAALGRPGYITLGHGKDLRHTTDIGSMEKNAHEVLDLAWERGVRYFDAARSYGKSEQFLSTWLKSRGIPERDITVGSKWGYRYTADWNIEAVHHEIKQKEGVYMGLSLSGTRQCETLDKSRQIAFDGVALFDTAQVTYNVLETSAEKALEEASAAGMGIIVKEALANGRLTPRNNHPAFHSGMRVLKEQSERLNCSIDALVLAGLLAKP